MAKRILVTGDRHWKCRPLAKAILNRLLFRHGPNIVIVHGAARGVDESFAQECSVVGIPHEPHPADWDRLGNSAGPTRNSEMVAMGAIFALAVHRNLKGSRGTLDCARKCWRAEIPVWLIDSDNPDATPKLLTERP